MFLRMPVDIFIFSAFILEVIHTVTGFHTMSRVSLTTYARESSILNIILEITKKKKNYTCICSIKAPFLNTFKGHDRKIQTNHFLTTPVCKLKGTVKYFIPG